MVNIYIFTITQPKPMRIAKNWPERLSMICLSVFARLNFSRTLLLFRNILDVEMSSNGSPSRTEIGDGAMKAYLAFI